MTLFRHEASMTRSHSRPSLSFVAPALFLGALSIFQSGCGRKDDTEAVGPEVAAAASAARKIEKGLEELYKTRAAYAAGDRVRSMLESNSDHYCARYPL